MDVMLRHTINDRLIPDAEAQLIGKFGTADSFIHGYGYHNHTHGYDVASAAWQIARELHMAGRVEWETILLARYAGWRHDTEQGTGHEQRSAQIAARSMRHHQVAEPYIAKVIKMIEATTVTGIDGYRIIQAADPQDPEQALLADADLSSLGTRRGVLASLLLGIEQQHLNGLATVPSPTNGADIVPDREGMLKFLRFQCGLYGNHQFMLEMSPRLFPHQQRNHDKITHLLALYEADRINYPEMLVNAKQYADQ